MCVAPRRIYEGRMAASQRCVLNLVVLYISPGTPPRSPSLAGVSDHGKLLLNQGSLPHTLWCATAPYGFFTCRSALRQLCLPGLRFESRTSRLRGKCVTTALRNRSSRQYLKAVDRRTEIRREIFVCLGGTHAHQEYSSLSSPLFACTSSLANINRNVGNHALRF
jgi:hypothetical protein